MKKMKWLIVIISVAVVGGVGFLAYSYFGPHYATTYEDASGWVYRCSQPIVVKDQGVKHEDGKPSLTAVSKEEAARYCASLGVE